MADETWAAKVAKLRQTLGRAPDLNEMLTLARTHRMTDDELREQQESYGRAEAMFGTDADEAAYRAAIWRGDGAEIERLDQAAQDRAARYETMKRTR